MYSYNNAYTCRRRLSLCDISHINGASSDEARRGKAGVRQGEAESSYNNLTLIRSQIMLHFLCANVVVVKCQAAAATTTTIRTTMLPGCGSATACECG